jgi:UDP-N-acetyl-D-galactosamine dehydrogenase
LRAYNTRVDVYDPWIIPEEAETSYGITCLRQVPSRREYAAVIVAVAHSQFVELGHAGIADLVLENGVVFDVRGILPLGSADGRL